MKGRVLVVDDEPAMRRTLQALLRLEGFEVDTAAEGREALRKLGETQFDVLVLDLRMPGMGGTEVLRHLEDIEADVGVIVLTGHGSLESAIEALRKGAYDYLLKPVDPETLLQSVTQAVARIRRERRQRTLYEQLERMLAELRQDISEHPEGTGFVPSTVELPNGVILDLGRRRLRYAGQDIHLSPSEARLLQVLLMQRGQVVSHQALVDAVHGYHVSPWEAPEIMRPIVSRLRRKLAMLPNGRRWIVNVRGVGYMLDWEAAIGEGEEAESGSDSP